MYLAGLAFYYGFMNNHPTNVPNAPVPVTQQLYKEATVPPITEITGRGRK
jgi:hypothetical protein